MGDGGLQQLIIVGFFLLFGLLDLVGRALKRRNQGTTVEPNRNDYADEQDEFDVFAEPQARRPERVQPKAPEPEYEVWREEPVIVRPAPAPPREQAREQPSVSAPRTAQSGPRQAPMRTAPERGSAPRVAALRVAPVRVQSARKASAGMTARDRLDTNRTGRSRGGAPLLNVHDARRAILAMTILGPCRAFEPHSDPSGSR